MSHQKRKDLKNISVILFTEGKQVFSGTLHEARKFKEKDGFTYRAELFGQNDLPVVSMDYEDLKSLLR